MAGGKLKKKIGRAKAVRAAGKIQPNPIALLRQGEMLLGRGLPGQAEKCFLEAWRQAPTSLTVLIRLADLYKDIQRYDEAAAFYEKALAIKPDVAAWCHNLGVLQLFLNNQPEALARFRQTLALDPENYWAHCNLGKAYMQMGQLDEALVAFRQALELNPDFAEAHYELAELYLVLGKKEDWERHCRRALLINSALTSAHLSLVKGLRDHGGMEEINSLEELLARPSITAMQKRDVFFALGMAYEGQGRYDEAFSNFKSGNRLQRRTFRYSTEEDAARFALVREKFTSSRFAGEGDGGCLEEGAIFIVGMPRSGTTLVEQILASHPRVFGAGEVSFLDELVRPCFNIDSIFDPAHPPDVLGREYMARLRAVPGAAGADLITDKMPHNFVHIGMIRLILPRARIIHCLRNPLDTCLSIYKNLFRGGHHYAYDLEELGRYYLLYRQLMQHWQEVLPNFVYNFSYERLIREPADQIGALLDFCKLDWYEGCLDFHKNRRQVKTLSVSQVRNPLYSSSLGISEKYGANLEPLKRIIGEDC